MWDLLSILDRLSATIATLEAELRTEQAVYGIDSLDELAIQQKLSVGLRSAYEVAREVHYPSSAGNKLTHRRRCDLVLTALGKPLRLDSKPPCLFDPPEQANPSEALWLEVKVAYQYREGGVRHGGYGSQWRDAVVNDLKKIETEPLIHHAGLLLVVFTESAEIFEKDVELFEDVLVRKEVLAGFRQQRSVPILDRMGNRLCSLVIWPTIQR